MKATNEALRTVRQHGVEHVLWCMSLTPVEMGHLFRDDSEQYERVRAVREAVGRQLARNTRNASRED